MRDAQIVRMLDKACPTELETVENYLASPVWLDGPRIGEV